MASEVPKPWSPFREIDRFHKDFDDLFDRMLRGRFVPETAAMPALESFIEGDTLTIRADLPGIDAANVEVTVTGDVLTLRGNRARDAEKSGRNFIYREISYGSFERTVALPDGVKADDVKASYKDGVLELRMPVPRGAGARKVPIQIDSGRKRGS